VVLHRTDYARAVRESIAVDALVSVTVPLVRDDLVLGAISVGRANLDEPFTAVECEVMQLLGAQAALALANARLHQEVSELAIHDGLTGLYNRRHFDATLDLFFARWRRNGGTSGLAAIMFDLDHFGRFNKEHGHQAGDAVLRAFAGLLHERLRSSDLVARYGGEEFVVIMEDCDLADAVAVAEDVRASLEARTIEGPAGQRLGARVSAGCATVDPATPTKEALLQAADDALFRAKRGGRNQVAAA
jgi:diguanylate cyclase (GGDEF)-like protein